MDQNSSLPSDRDIHLGDEHCEPPHELLDMLDEGQLRVLKDLHAKGGEDFDMYLDDTVSGILQGIPEFVENIEKLRGGGDVGKVRERQNELYEGVLGGVLRAAEIAEHQAKSEKESRRDILRTKLVAAQAANPETFDPLTTLGILQKDQDGNEYFSYPKGLFAKETDSRWHTYLDAVRQHISTVNKFERGHSNKADLVSADNTRRIAHNALARDLQYYLGLPGHDLEDYRRLAVKMREQRFPNINTGERERTNKSIVVALRIGETVTNALHEHLLPPDAIFGGDEER